MTVYIFKGDECVDEYEIELDLPVINLRPWHDFGSWLRARGYFKPGYKIEFK